MSAFGGLIMTNKGRVLQAKAQTGVELKYTRFGLGDGTLGNSQIIELNALKNEVISLPIGKLKVSSGTAVVGSILNNNNISSGFYFREIGIFATDPDIGEILYCYGNAGNLAEYIPAGGGTDVVEKAIDVQVLTGNAPNVSAVINQSLIFETPEGAQEKADVALNDSKVYTDLKMAAIDLSVLATKQELQAVRDDATTHKADEAAHGIGNKATLLTTNKTTVVAALNELFTNANSLKTDWAGVVGSPLLTADTSAQLKSKTQTIKNTLATNLTAKGQSSVGTETFTALVNKVANVNTGKPFASGAGTVIATRTLSIRLLSFRPNYIIVYLTANSQNRIASLAVFSVDGDIKNKNKSSNTLNYYVDTGYIDRFNDSGVFTIYDDGFTCEIDFLSPYKWMAIG